MDKEYEKLRNSLIPEAEKFANKYCGESYEGDNQKEREAWSKKWSRTFIRRMDHLYALTQQAPACPYCNGTGVVMGAPSDVEAEYV